MRAANILLFASALGLSFLGAALNGPDFSFDASAPAKAAACANGIHDERPSEPAHRELEGCPAP